MRGARCREEVHQRNSHRALSSPGTEFAFDSPTGEPYEGHALKRAGKFGVGTWSFTVQLNAVGGGSCYLDDWYFDIEGHSTS